MGEKLVFDRAAGTSEVLGDLARKMIFPALYEYFGELANI